MEEPTAESTPGPLTDFRFGGIAVWGGIVEPNQLDAALLVQQQPKKDPAPRIGELLVEAGRLTRDDVRRVLRVQLQRMPAEGHLLFGRIAVARRFASAREVEAALDEQSRQVLAGGTVSRLGEILLARGAITKEQVDAILAYQASSDAVPMSEAREGIAPESNEPKPEDEPLPSERPAFLPRGAWGFVLDNCIWITAALAIAAAVFVAAFRESIFG